MENEPENLMYLKAEFDKSKMHTVNLRTNGKK